MFETKKDEIVITTSDPKEMMGKYTAERVTRGWMEDFVDEDTGDVVQIERNEIIIDRGVLLESDQLSSLMFYLQSGDIKEVKVSNQRREGVFVNGSDKKVWSATVAVNNKKYRYLLYANSLEIATEIVKDYVELHHSGYCQITKLSEFGNYIIIEELLSEADQINDEDTERKLYKVEVKVLLDEEVQYYAFLLFATDVESSQLIINNHLSNLLEKKDRIVIPEFTLTIESATTIGNSKTIEKDFSEVYFKKEEILMPETSGTI